MPRRYRYVILAALGWLSLGATTPANQKGTTGQNSQTAEEVSKASNAIVAAIRETNKPSEEDRGCEDGQEDRNSSLCADWKAADAAQEAADYAFWSLIGTAIGTSLLIWTLWETRSSSRRELRAYVSVKVFGLEVTEYRTGHLNLVFRTVAHNGGATPAYNCNHFGFIAAMSQEEAASKLGKVQPIHSSAEKGGAVIHAGEDFTSMMTNSSVIDPHTLSGLKSGALRLYAFGVTSYFDTFGVKRRTDFCYSLAAESFNQAMNESRGRPGEQVPLEWLVAPFHNEAT